MVSQTHADKHQEQFGVQDLTFCWQVICFASWATAAFSHWMVQLTKIPCCVVNLCGRIYVCGKQVNNLPFLLSLMAITTFMYAAHKPSSPPVAPSVALHPLFQVKSFLAPNTNMATTKTLQKAGYLQSVLQVLLLFSLSSASSILCCDHILSL